MGVGILHVTSRKYSHRSSRILRRIVGAGAGRKRGPEVLKFGLTKTGKGIPVGSVWGTTAVRCRRKRLFWSSARRSSHVHHSPRPRAGSARTHWSSLPQDLDAFLMAGGRKGHETGCSQWAFEPSSPSSRSLWAHTLGPEIGVALFEEGFEEPGIEIGANAPIRAAVISRR